VRKYCRRWLVEKGIAEQIDFFHLNRVSSSMVIKVDFDLIMTVLAHNIYRLLASKLERKADGLPAAGRVICVEASSTGVPIPCAIR
jgi:hypothetical protein